MKTLPRRPHKLQVASSSVSVPRVQTLLVAFAISLFVILTGPVTLTVAHAQMDMLRFERISTEQGLSQNTVTSILQDRQGYMWFGTEGGLNRYDGHQFTIYQHDPDSPKSLGNDTVFALFEDHAGILWVGTGNGLDRYDPATASFAHYTHDANDLGSLGASFVLAINLNRRGREIWVAGWPRCEMCPLTDVCECHLRSLLTLLTSVQKNSSIPFYRAEAISTPRQSGTKIPTPWDTDS